MQELKELAILAVQSHIQGVSLKRNSLLKPLDIILQELDRCPAPDNDNELELVKAGTKEMIFDFLDRINKGEYKLGRRKQEQVNAYVDLFFNGVLNKAHQGKVNKLLSREKLIRSAYLFYFREAMPQKTVANVAIGASDSEYPEDKED